MGIFILNGELSLSLFPLISRTDDFLSIGRSRGHVYRAILCEIKIANGTPRREPFSQAKKNGFEKCHYANKHISFKIARGGRSSPLPNVPVFALLLSKQRKLWLRHRFTLYLFVDVMIILSHRSCVCTVCRPLHPRHGPSKLSTSSLISRERNVRGCR